MKIQGLEGAICFRASVLTKKYGIPIKMARSLKLGEIVDVGADKARQIIEDNLAEPLSPVTEIDEEDKDKEDL